MKRPINMSTLNRSTYIFVGFLLFVFLGNVAAVGQTNISGIRFGSTDTPLNGLNIAWSSSGAADSIAWGYTSGLEKGTFLGHKSSSITGTRFEFTFPELSAASVLYYAIFDSKENVWTEQRTFITASGASANQFSFTVLGDSRSYPADWKIISDATFDTDFTLFMGDIVNDGKIAADWEAWFEYGEQFISRETIYHCIGNHDDDHSASRFENFFGLFTLPGNEMYYSFNYGNAVFICLNSERAGDPEQYDWLLSTLETNKDQTWKIVFFHKPFYTAPSHSGEMDEHFDTWWKAFDDYGVDMIFNGHTHNYQRTKPINRCVSTNSAVKAYGSAAGMGRCQIVAGNAGAPLSDAADPGLWWLGKSAGKRHFCNIEIDGERLSMKAMDANQVVFDSLILDKNNSEITFQVDLREVGSKENVAAARVNFKSLDTSYVMSDTDGDGVYMFTLPPVSIGSELIYSFSYQTGSDSESGFVEEALNDTCCNNQGYRNLKVPYGSFALPKVVFGTCSEAPQNVCFQVDLSEVTDLVTGAAVWVASDSWDKPCLMSDADGDSIFTVTMALAAGTGLKYFFAYQSGADPAKDYVRESGSGKCFDEQGNRELSIGYKDQHLPAVLFNSCQEALPPGFDITDLRGITIKGSNDDEPWEGGSGSPAGEKIAMLIDNNIDTKYLVRAEKSWIEINTNRLSMLSAYTITSANDEPKRDPKDWQLQGWETETNSWVTIHSVKDNPKWDDRFKRKSWFFQNDKWYRRYRLKITAVNSYKDVLMQMSELHLFGKLDTSEPVE